jgi:hypothetical protein
MPKTVTQFLNALQAYYDADDQPAWKAAYKSAARSLFNKLVKRYAAVNVSTPAFEFSFNPGGHGVPGEFHFKIMFAAEQGVHVFSCDPTPNCVIRKIKHLKDHTGGPNGWLMPSAFVDLEGLADVMYSVATR